MSDIEQVHRDAPNWGVGIFAILEGAEVRVRIEDLQKMAGETGDLPSWASWAFVTDRTFDRDTLLQHRLPRDLYLALGQTVMARLVAQIHALR